MTKHKTLFLVFVGLSILINACTVEKRLYIKGFHIEWRSAPVKPATAINDQAQPRVTLLKPEKIAPPITGVTPHLIEHSETTANKNLFLAATKPDSIPPECDLIVLRGKDTIKGKITEVGIKTLKYTSCHNPDFPSREILLRRVTHIVYANGFKEAVFSDKKSELSLPSMVFGGLALFLSLSSPILGLTVAIISVLLGGLAINDYYRKGANPEISFLSFILALVCLMAIILLFF
jgi:hypothetical protein